jgi:hypothetical protein
MHVVDAVYTGIVLCFLAATITGLVSATSKPIPGGMPGQPLSVASAAVN